MAGKIHMRRRREGFEPGAIDLVEQAFHSLRTAPWTALAAYAVGTIPFVLGLLYFWADMTHSPFARARCAQGAWGLAFLYLWMRCWQAFFASRMRAHLRHEPAPRWGLAGLARTAAVQVVWGPIGLVALAVSAFLMIPFGWVYAWHQNMIAMSDRADLGPAAAARQAQRLAAIWPLKNHYALSILVLFRCVVFLSLMILIAVLPGLAKSLLGIASVFTTSMYWMTNTTFLAAVVGLTFLCVDPLMKTLYVVRCHYGESLRTGEDLLAELGRQRTVPLAAVVAALLLLAAPPAPAAPAAAPAVEATELRVDELDGAIDRVMQRSEYVWRLPRELLPEAEFTEKNIIERFAEGLADFSRRVAKAVGRAIERFGRWLEKKLHLRDRPLGGPGMPGDGWKTGLEALTWCLFGVVALALAWMVWKSWRRRRPRTDAGGLEALQPAVDVADESVIASQLPEDEWIAMAEKLRAEGEWRKAMRAYFLGMLAWLARREFVEIRRSKSNRDYARELERRSRRLPALPPLFALNVTRFERSWYGREPVTETDLDGVAKDMRNLHALEPK
jgi:hypothetical protein